MRRSQIFCAIVGTLIAGPESIAVQAAPRQRPCAEIRAACEQAGFVQGGSQTGDGLFVDCIVPILKGRPQPRRATKPLPEIDLQLVAACKAQNPNFGQRSASPVPRAILLARAQRPSPRKSRRRDDAMRSHRKRTSLQRRRSRPRLLPRPCKGCRRHERMKVVSTKNKLWSTHGRRERFRSRQTGRAAPFPRRAEQGRARISEAQRRRWHAYRARPTRNNSLTNRSVA